MSVELVGGTREDLLGTAITSVGNAEGSPVRIPASRYHSSDFAALEEAHVWPRVWQIACSVDHVSEPGDYFEYRAGPFAILIVPCFYNLLRFPFTLSIMIERINQMIFARIYLVQTIHRYRTSKY